MSTADTFELRARSAGAALRDAFYEGDPMTAPTTLRPPSVQQDDRRSSRGRTLLAAAAAVALVAAGAGVALDSFSDEEALPPAEQTQEEVVAGLPGLPDFPIRLTVPSTLKEEDEDAGTRAFSIPGQSGGILITALRSVNGIPASDLPADVTTLLSRRPDLVVTAKGSATIDGRTAQSFSLLVAPNMRPSDVWCPLVEELCFKLGVGQPMDVLVVPTDAAPLWIGVEYMPGSKAAVTAAAQQLIDSIELD